jgi:2-polyprenyl-6-methoxyphenol hydroxylase-like FAD-dependent oxidoreductase
MEITEKHTKVLIVGAGPSGLMMAAQLLRYGIRPIIVDSKRGPTTHSNALAVQARSLEIYRQMGIVDNVVKNGKSTLGIELNQDGKQQASIPINNVGKGLTAFPYVLLYQQYKNERLLLDYLTQNLCPVYWDTVLTSLRQKAAYAETSLKNGDKEHNFTCDWVIGADGAHSAVRKQLQVLFNGDTYPSYFYLADLKINTTFLTGDFIQLYLGKDNLAAFFPMPEKDCYRIIGNLPGEFENRDDVNVADVLPYLSGLTKSNVEIVENQWFTTYKLHHRMADQFRVRRCFLIGDAAHIHSPVGGQGMNTGLQDAYNLAWKLAGVVNDQFNPSILNSYAVERMPVAKTLLRTTDRVFNIVMSGNWLTGLFKKWLLPSLVRAVWSKESFRETFFKRVSQISIAYRHSPLSLHLSPGTKIKAGDRLPYMPIYDEKKQEETDLHAWCSKPGFTLIILGKFEEMFLFRLARWITMNYTGILNFYYLPPSGKNLDVFNAFEASPHGQKAIIVRPDLHIGFINDQVDMALMGNYLQNVIGVGRS